MTRVPSRDTDSLRRGPDGHGPPRAGRARAFGGISVPLARVFGVDVFAHWSMALVPFVLLGVIASVFGESIGAAESLTWAVVGTFLTVLVAASHELVHVLVARRSGAAVNAVVLTPLSAILHDDPPRLPTGAAVLTHAGGVLVHVLWMVPAALVSLWLGGGGDGAPALASGVGTEAGPADATARTFLLANAGLAALNLLPIHPLDGGRILRAVLETSMTRRRAGMATAYAAYAGSVVLALVGLTLLLSREHAAIGWAALLLVAGATTMVAAQRLILTTQFLERPRMVQQSWASPRARAPDSFGESDLLSAAPAPVPPHERRARGERGRPGRTPPSVSGVGAGGRGRDDDGAAARPDRSRDPVAPGAGDSDASWPAAARHDDGPPSVTDLRSATVARIDALLDRIVAVGGVEGLTDDERDELRRAGKRLSRLDAGDDANA